MEYNPVDLLNSARQGMGIPPGKENRVMIILDRWVKGEITVMQADRELEVAGVKLPKSKEGD